MHAVESRRARGPGDRAIGRLLLHCGLRVSELVVLDVEDVPLSARNGNVLVRARKGEDSREVPVARPRRNRRPG
ncbi:tyrosine-type recombinase/integrase [Nocardia sp. NPDC047038]|uniref:tyrosine-type recombinase/integrase n=1 Tax=Nocardia sp. NPDC047038 TaxID=3154338 RepID=UPI0033F7FA27